MSGLNEWRLLIVSQGIPALGKCFFPLYLVLLRKDKGDPLLPAIGLLPCVPLRPFPKKSLDFQHVYGPLFDLLIVQVRRATFLLKRNAQVFRNIGRGFPGRIVCGRCDILYIQPVGRRHE